MTKEYWLNMSDELPGNISDTESRPVSAGDYIRLLRTQKGLTQLALAQQLHVTDKAVSKWERNLSLPDIRLLPKLADALGITVGDLIRVFDTEEDSEELLVQHYNKASDLRTPLHIIHGCADLLETYQDDKDKFQHYLELIRVSCRYLLNTLD